LSPGAPLSKQIKLGPADTLKLLLTTTEDKTAKRPHQAFLTLHEPKTGLEESFVFTVKESGKARVELVCRDPVAIQFLPDNWRASQSQKDLPFQFLTASDPIQAKLLIASFGSSDAYYTHAFDLAVTRDANAPLSTPEAPLRYGKLSEIHHIFRSDPKSSPTILSSVFTLAILACLPVLVGTWLFLGANFSHVSKAMNAAPISHTLFFGSIVAMEFIFFLYYSSWTLFQILPPAGLVGTVAFLSGSKALGEVQQRRLAGLR
jgi:oligosaccharyltransferase complex subunit delta (ribophorin II)